VFCPPSSSALCSSYLSLVLHVDSWSILAFHAVLAIALCIVAKVLLASYNSQRVAGSTATKKGQ
jgi:hypothetical protein